LSVIDFGSNGAATGFVHVFLAYDADSTVSKISTRLKPQSRNF